MPKLPTDLNQAKHDLAKTAQEAAYVVVGLGVIGVQRAQVRRHELAEAMDRIAKRGATAPLGDARSELARRMQVFDETVSVLIERLDARFEPVEQRLPTPAKAVVQQAKDARNQLRVRLVSFAA